MKAIIAIPVTLALMYRAWSKASLTSAGIVVAALTAIAHAVHPWNLPYTLLIVFFLSGTRVTKVKHAYKSQLTVQASGKGGGEGSRTHVQVLANSGVASFLSLLHAYHLFYREESNNNQCFSQPSGDVLFVGIVANYAAVAADTFSSELGILSKSQPRLITSINLRRVPPGTNGGITIFGLAAGMLGSLIIATATVLLTPFCKSQTLINNRDDQKYWDLKEKLLFFCAITIWGALGSLLDSFLGGWLQQSVIDTRSGKIIEGEGGKRVLVEQSKLKKFPLNLRDETCQSDKIKESHSNFQTSSSEQRDRQIYAGANGVDNHDTKDFLSDSDHKKLISSRAVESGSFALLDNNGVNIAMAFSMSVGAMLITSWIY